MNQPYADCALRLAKKGFAAEDVVDVLCETAEGYVHRLWDPLPAKQRPTHPNDWMTTDADIACPDPHCGGRFRITRTGTSTFRHADVTLVPLPAAGES
jgi:uncharacterized repeat protein (TIGR04076 family)